MSPMRPEQLDDRGRSLGALAQDLDRVLLLDRDAQADLRQAAARAPGRSGSISFFWRAAGPAPTGSAAG